MLSCYAVVLLRPPRDDLWGHFPSLIISLMPLVSLQKACTPELDLCMWSLKLFLQTFIFRSNYYVSLLFMTPRRFSSRKGNITLIMNEIQSSCSEKNTRIGFRQLLSVSIVR